ncbi:S41 family peptidase [Permianibacter sp. IMCC34836]|nr:S41 family peptidase [Permianibacter fluminis]
MVRPRVLLPLLFGLAFSGAAMANSEAPDNATLPLTELQALTDALARIKANYVEPVDDKQLLEGAIAGMLATLDPHSSYLPGKDLQRLTEMTRGEYSGVGLEVAPENGQFRVITAMDDSPAQKAGVRSGDLLLRIDSELTRGLKMEDIVNRLRGDAGSKVTVQLAREGSAQPIELVLVRDNIQTASVRQELLDNGIGYLRLSQFQQDSGIEVINALQKLKTSNKGALRGLIFDLRNNPGGVLGAAAAVADAFLTDGVIVSTKGRVSGSNSELRARPDDLLDGAPMVVLINNGSASAAEIVAGALQDNHRAILVGSRSFGKGSVQTVQKISGDGAIKLTTARYYTPSGRSIQASGIEPDVPVAAGKLVADAPRPSVREADLPHALRNQQADGNAATTVAVTSVNGRDIAEDIQLATAINLLRGLAVLQK